MISKQVFDKLVNKPVLVLCSFGVVMGKLKHVHSVEFVDLEIPSIIELHNVTVYHNLESYLKILNRIQDSNHSTWDYWYDTNEKASAGLFLDSIIITIAKIDAISLLLER